MPARSKPNKTVGFVTFESEFAPLGGLAAVMRWLPKRLARSRGWSSWTMAPFFRSITRCKDKLYRAIESTGHQYVLTYDARPHAVEIFRHVDESGFQTFLLDSSAFFNAPCNCQDPPTVDAPCNPYLTPGHPDQLLEDALFFCAAVPQALIALGYTKNIVLNLQDWETACVAITVKDHPETSSVTCLLTLHNSYDQPIRPDDLRKISSRACAGETVLSATIPVMDGPITTVSENFAQELRHEPLHSSICAPHLQDEFSEKTIVGINNGLFTPSTLPESVLTAADEGELQPLMKMKRERRLAMIEELEDYQPDGAWGTLEWSRFEGPVFLFLGRDDPRQKGYDLAAAAIRRLPQGVGRYIFTPIPGDEGIEGLAFLRALANERRGEVKVFPFRMARGFAALQRGASFFGMCSLYEPFGAATEGYAVATPVVARATGGLVQQVVPYPSACLTETVQRSSRRYWKKNQQPTGFLFREAVLSPGDVEAGWKDILACGYWPDQDRVQERLSIPLFEAMVQAATQAFLDAIDFYINDKPGYAQMMVNGIHLLDHFSWDAAVKKYRSLYQSVLTHPLSSVAT